MEWIIFAVLGGVLIIGIVAIASWDAEERKRLQRALGLPLIVLGGKTYLRKPDGSQRLLFDHLASEGELESLKVMGRRVFEENLKAREAEAEIEGRR